MRLIASALCAYLISALFVVGIRCLQASSPQRDDNLVVLKGRVATPGTPCRGGGRSSTFMLQMDVAGTYRFYRLVCDEVVRASAVGGTEVIFDAKPVIVGNQDAWLIRRAKVDGRSLWEPRNFWGRPTEGEKYLFLTVGMLLFLVIGAIAVPGEQPRHAASSSKWKRR